MPISFLMKLYLYIEKVMLNKEDKISYIDP